MTRPRTLLSLNNATLDNDTMSDYGIKTIYPQYVEDKVDRDK